MSEALLMRMHEAILFIYLLSVACYLYDYIQKNDQIKRIGFILLCVVFGLQTLSIGLFIAYTGRFPVQTIIEGFYFYTWLIIGISIILTVVKKSELIMFMMNVIGIIFMSVHTFTPLENQTETSASHLMNELLFVHVTLAILAYAQFLVACIHAILYLIQMKNLKKKRFNQKYFRMNDLASLSRMVQLFSSTGAIVLFISLILGIQWGMILIGPSIWTDSKVIGSIFVLIMYLIYIYFYERQQIRMNVMMELNIVLFLICMINYLVISRYSEFHLWMN